jgi:hypothetical protein
MTHDHTERVFDAHSVGARCVLGPAQLAIGSRSWTQTRQPLQCTATVPYTQV